MCGIFGVINHHKRQLDKRAFITLGCANDARGGDACGIMIDRQVERGTEKENKYFQEWYHESKLLNDTEKCYVALGHCRKASVGGVSADKAQPVTIYDNDGNLMFCMVHNGTIYNYKELAEKYIPTIDIKGLTDSQVMGYIFYYAGYDALKEYNGGGAFVIQDYRTNKTYIFRGESRPNANTTKVEAERPLYLVETGKSVVFSSIYPILQGLYWGFTIYDMPSNILLECDGETIYKVQEYDRSECYGCKIYTPSKKEQDFYYTGGIASKVYFDPETGCYYDSSTKELLHGIIHVGKLLYMSKYGTCYNKPFYFWNGILLQGESAYNAVRNLFAEGASIGAVLNLARRLSYNPVMVNRKYWTYNENHKRVPYDDICHFLLSDISVYCNEKGVPIITYNEKEISYLVPTPINPDKLKNIVDYVKAHIQ